VSDLVLIHFVNNVPLPEDLNAENCICLSVVFSCDYGSCCESKVLESIGG